MNEVIKAMKERRSIRKFKPEIPSKEIINQIADAGLYAPNGKNLQAVITLVVTDKKLRDKLSRMNQEIGGFQEGFDPFYGAPVVIVVLADKSVPTYVYDGTLVMGNMLLAAQSLDLGAIWIHRAKQEFEIDEMKAFLKELGIEGEWEGIGHCAIGYVEGDRPGQIPRKPGRVFYI